MIFTLVTDAWSPQVNGVVRTWQQVTEQFERWGHRVEVIHPGQFRTIAAPRYPEIRLALGAKRGVHRRLDDLSPDAIHIATEGPLGQAARKYCLKRGLAFTTSYHTQFPMYLRRYFGIPQGFSYRFIRWFHGPARAVLVPTATVARELEARGLGNTVVWRRGVDTDVFKPEPAHDYDLPRPIFLYAGRVAIEKNIEAFLELDLPGSKVVVGDGPPREALAKRYPEVHFAGYKFGEELAAHYAGADVFVFPSKTDTYGVVMLEANACGLPVAAYPVTGPIDVVQQGKTGYVDKDLAAAARRALDLEPAECLAFARANSWEACARVVLDHLAPLRDGTPTPVNASPARPA